MPTAPPPSRATVRLTDQAVVAVHIARSLAGSRTPNVGHLVAGIAGEPEGRAGLRIRALSGEGKAAAFSRHAGLAAPLPRLATALLALPVEPDVAWTDDLVAAAVRVGGQDLADLLDDAGIHVPGDFPLRSRPDPADILEGADGETFGRGTFIARGFDDRADRALAHARAAGDTISALTPWLELDSELRRDYGDLPDVPIRDAVDIALAAGERGSVGLGGLAAAVLRAGIRRMTGPTADGQTD